MSTPACTFLRSKGWNLPEERLAAYIEQGMPEKLKPYLMG